MRKQETLFGLVEYWSYSQIKSLLRCPAEFEQRYLRHQEGKINVSGIDPWVGRVLHQVVADFFLESARQEDVQSCLFRIYDKVKPQKPEWSTNPLGDGRARAALREFARSEVSRRAPIGVEEKIEFSLGNVVVQGRADLVWRPVAGEDGLGILEFKLTEGESENLDPEERYLQLFLYCEGVRAKRKEPVHRIGHYYFGTGELSEIEPTESLLRAGRKKFLDLVDQAHGNSFPARVNRFCQSCPFASSCAEYVKSREGLPKS